MENQFIFTVRFQGGFHAHEEIANQKYSIRQKIAQHSCRLIKLIEQQITNTCIDILHYLKHIIRESPAIFDQKLI